MDNQEQKYILFFSKRCKYCEDFMNKLYKKNIELYRMFKKIDIDSNIKLPDYIKMVPTIIVPSSNNKPVLHSADNVFKWLDSVSNNSNKGSNNQTGNGVNNLNTGNNGIADFDPFQMNGFSTSYSSINDNVLPEKNFSQYSLASMDYTLGISAPNEEKKSDKLREGDTMSRTIEDFKAQRDAEIKKPISRV
jgi:hypothetical protein